MKFILYVEGKTEKMVLSPFLRRWFDSQGFAERLALQIVVLSGKGGIEKEYAKMVNKDMNGRHGDTIVGVVGLLDLFRSKLCQSETESVESRCAQGKKFVEKKVGHPKFRMFFAVQELEAWLLSQPAIFQKEVADRIPKKATAQPESVNSTEPPAKLLGKLYRTVLKNKEYKKTVDGPSLFKKLDPQRAYDKCPHLREMLDEMLKMAQEAA